jgi:hypothetical protein
VDKSYPYFFTFGDTESLIGPTKIGAMITMTSPPMQSLPRDPDETVDLKSLIEDVVPDAGMWKETPNAALGGRKPADLINTSMEPILRNMLRAVKHGMIL